MADYTAITKEIRDIFLDHRTTVRAEETSDGSGKEYLDYELDCTKEQEEEVGELIRLFMIERLETYLNNILATEDAKRIHYE